MSLCAVVHHGCLDMKLQKLVSPEPSSVLVGSFELLGGPGLAIDGVR